MRGEQIAVVIRSVESEIDVSTARFRDFEVWPVVRMMVGAASKEEARSMPRRPVHRLRGIPSLPLQIGELLRPPAVSASRRWAVLLNQRSTLQRCLAGGFRDTYGDPLRHLLLEVGILLDVWDRADVDDRRRPTANRVTPVDVGLGMAAVAASAQRRAGRAPRSLTQAIEGLTAVVRRHGVELNSDDAVARVLAIDRMATFLARRLGSRPPALGFVVCFYGLSGLGFTLACRRRGVLSIDMQHGVQGAGHLAYGPWSGTPGPRAALIPDRFWCWTEEDAARIDDSFGKGRAVVGGNLRLTESGDPRGDGITRRRAEREILVSLQPNLPLPDPVRAAIASGPESWRWWIRPHPTMTVGEALVMVPEAALKRALVEEAATAPLAALLGRADVHVTGYSSVVLEAEVLGVPSVLTDTANGAWFFSDQLARGSATLASSTEELIRLIATAERLTSRPQPDPKATVRLLLDVVER